MKKTLLLGAAAGLLLSLSAPAQQIQALKKVKAQDPSLAAYNKILQEKSRIIREAKKGTTDRRTIYANLRKGLAVLDKELLAFLSKYPHSPKVMAVLQERMGLLNFLGKRGEADSILKEMEKRARTVSDFKAVALAVARKNRDGKAGIAYLDSALKKAKAKEIKAAIEMARLIFLGNNKEKQTAILKRVAKEYKGTKPAELARLKLQALNLKKGVPPINLKIFKDIDGKPIDLSAYKGKVLLMDFWATWCGPCMRELPNVLEAYKKYHKKGFEILGISFDLDRAQFEKVIKERGMTWRHYFDGKGWGNEIGSIYNIHAIPHTILVGKDGKIAAINLRGEKLIEAVRELVEGAE